MLSDGGELAVEVNNPGCLNAPFGARCFLTDEMRAACEELASRLKAPFGARCFLTLQATSTPNVVRMRLNAPFGARCFLTSKNCYRVGADRPVLMHLLALGAF